MHPLIRTVRSCLRPALVGLLLVLGSLGAARLTAASPRLATASPNLATAGADGDWRSLFPHWPVGVTGNFLQDPLHDRALLLTTGEVWQIASVNPPTWTLLGTPAGPAPNGYAVWMVYDSQDDRIIAIVGAYAPSVPQVWELPLATMTWNQLTSTGGLANWFAFSFGFDADHHRLIMSGGYDQAYLNGPKTTVARTYQIAFGPGTAVWTSAVDPGANKYRSGPAFNDAKNHRMILFGSTMSDVLVCDYTNPTLVWSFPVTSGTPPSGGRAGADVILDPVRNSMLLYGGYVSTSFANDLYRLTVDGTWTWSPVPIAGTPPMNAFHSGSFYDPVGDQMITRGGPTIDGVWAVNFAGTPTWTDLSLSHPVHGGDEGGVAVLDVPGNRMIVTGDWNTNDTWELPLSPPVAWNKLAPPSTPSPVRTPAVGVFDSARRRLLLFGGSMTSSPYSRLNDVWALDLSSLPPTWSQVATTGTPASPRVLSTGIYDPVRDRLIVFGGFDYTHVDVNDVWALSLAGTPSWAQIIPTGTPPLPQEDPSAVYDPVRDRMLIFSRKNSQVHALSLSGTPDWELLPSAPLTALYPAYDPVRDRVVALDAPTGATYALTLGGTPVWSTLDLTGYIHPGDAIARLVYDAVHDQVVAHGLGYTSTSFALSSRSAVDVPPGSPAGLALAASWPNPAGDHTTFRFSLPRAARVTLSIHDVAGRTVRSWTRSASAGSGSVEWNLTTEQGARVPPGLFLYSLDADGKRLTRRLVVVR